MCSCKRWTVKKAEHQRIDAFELWCWRRLLRVSWTERRSNQSISREINPFGRTDAETETPVFWSPDTNSWLFGKVPDTGKDWQQKEKRASEDEMARWHHYANGYELGQTSGGGERQRSLACCSPWGCKELDMTGQMNNSNRSFISLLKFIPRYLIFLM